MGGLSLEYCDVRSSDYTLPTVRADNTERVLPSSDIGIRCLNTLGIARMTVLTGPLARIVGMFSLRAI